MSWLGLPLTLLAGGALGAFGAGGSILMVPILVYVVGIPAKSAIAVSLLAVGVTSTVALVTHLRSGRVQWRTGLFFGLAAMAGAYAGGRAADHLDGSLLLAGFALLMVMTAFPMLRRRGGELGDRAPRAHRMAPGPAMLAGVCVGFVAGLVGAGGGFLIVPALVLLGGLGMRSAIATSLLVIAMQSFAGLLGHASHLELDWPLAVAVTAFSVTGSAVGSRFSAVLPAARLRRGFGWLVGAIGLVMLALQLPPPWLATARHAIVVAAPLLGGAVIGLAAALLWLLNGRIAGVSGIFGGILRTARGDHLWRVLFLAGLALGGLAMRMLMPGAFEASAATPGLIVLAGLLVGFGTTLGNGCTSGHGVCGVSRLSPRSLAAVGTFMAAGMVTVYLAQHVLGGAR
jgi:uncharacterized membrane protein YfcA